MNKELNIIEASNMPENTLFDVKIDCYYKQNDAIRIRDNTKLKAMCTREGIRFLEYADIEKASKTLLNARFIPVQKSVSFIDAIKASQEGKTIWVNVEDRTYTYYPNPRDKKFDELRAKETHGGLSTYEILNGKWYIED